MLRLQKNSELMFSRSFFNMSEFKLLSPKSTWPTHPKTTETKIRKWAASSLTVDGHFCVHDMNDSTRDVIEKYTSQFMEPSMEQLLARIDLEARRVTLDIIETTTMLSRFNQGHERNESDIRIAVLDPLLKGVVRCTGTFFRTEDPIQVSPEPLDDLPQYQESNSEKSIQDYTLHKVISGVYCTVFIWEAKRGSKFDLDSVAQTVGYYIGSSMAITTQQGLHSPMALVLCENQCRVIMFPFCANNEACVDAVVSPVYPIFLSEKINMDIFLLMVRYTFYFDHCPTVETNSLILHPKKAYQEFIMTRKEEVAVLKDALEKAEQDKEKAEQDKEKAEQDKEKAEQDKEKAERDKEKAERDKEKAERDKEKAERDKEIAERDKENAEQDKKDMIQKIAEVTGYSVDYLLKECSKPPVKRPRI